MRDPRFQILFGAATQYLGVGQDRWGGTGLSIWAVYARVSTEEQAKFGASLGSQVEAARLRATDLGATEIVVFVDQGVPGDVLTRPGLTKLRDAIANRAIAGVVVYDPDRLARNLSLQLLITEEIQNAGLKLEFVNFEWKDTDEGRLFYSIRGAIAEYEKAKIRERTTRGKWAKARQGFSPTGRVPYGYTFDKHSKRISVNTQTVPHLQSIFTWLTADDLGPSRIANRLNAMQVPPPLHAPRWGASSIRHIVRNPAYLGRQIVHRLNTEGTHRNPHIPKEQRKAAVERPAAEWLTIAVPRLIDDRTWDLANRALANLSRKYAGRPEHHFFLLKRLIACGICGLSMYGMKLNRGKACRYYRCTSGIRAGYPKCGMRSMPADDLEESIWQQIVAWATDSHAHRAAVQDARDAEHHRMAGPDLQWVKLQWTEAQAEQAQLGALVARGLVRLEHVSAALRELEGRVQHLAEVIKETQDRQSLRPGWTAAEAAPLSAADLWAFAPDQRYATVKRYLERVFVYPDGKLRLVPRLQPLVVNS